MCGIASVIAREGADRDIAKRIFKTLMLGNEMRGSHSTGVLAIDRDDDSYSLFKGAIPSSTFMNRKKFNQVQADVWIGHTRYATMGDVNERNAHPLNRNNIFLVHNGVISNHKELAKKYGLEYQVDSEVLSPYIESEDWEGLQELQGSANFIAWDKSKSRLYMERHDNPLYILELSELGIVCMSSRLQELDIMAGHYSRGDEVDEVPEDIVIQMDMRGVITGSTELKFKKSYPLIPATKLNSDTRRTRQYKNDYDYDHDWEDSYYNGYYGKPFDTDEYMALNKEEYGCEVCGCDISSDESIDSIGEFGYHLCPSCMVKLREYTRKLTNGEEIGEFDTDYEHFEDILFDCGLLSYQYADI